MRITSEQACAFLQEGRVVAIPTETVYGLAASLSCLEAIEDLYRIKGRPKRKPMTIQVSDVKHVAAYAQNIPESFDLLAKTFWPGALTLVLPAKMECVPEIVRAGLDSAAFRIPGHSLTLQLLERVGPLVVPSENLSGKPSGTCVEHVEQTFGRDFPVLDGERSEKGIESTILTYQDSQWRMLRWGALSPKKFEACLGYQPKYLVASSP